jgi:hypothetical protein
MKFPKSVWMVLVFSVSTIFAQTTSTETKPTLLFDEELLYPYQRLADKLITEAPEVVERFDQNAIELFHRLFPTKPLERTRYSKRVASLLALLPKDPDRKIFILEVGQSTNLTGTQAIVDSERLVKTSPMVVLGKTVFIKEEILRDKLLDDRLLLAGLLHEFGHHVWDNSRRQIYAAWRLAGDITQSQFIGLVLMQEIAADRKALQEIVKLNRPTKVNQEDCIRLFSRLQEMGILHPEVAYIREREARAYYRRP